MFSLILNSDSEQKCDALKASAIKANKIVYYEGTSLKQQGILNA